MSKINYVLDTSVYLTDADSIFNFGDHDIYIPLKVLEEIDKQKKRQDSAGVNARRIIRALDDLRGQGSLQEGVKLGEHKGTLRVISYEVLKDVIFPPDLDLRVPDHIIIATALAVRSQHINKKTCLVSRDINMRVICDSVGLDCEDYATEKVILSSEQLYPGFVTHAVDDQVIDRFYNDENIIISKDDVKEIWHHKPLSKIIHDKVVDWKINARNKEQAFAIDLLLDPTVKIVSLVGQAGSGKTLCAIAAGLQQTIGLRGTNIYDRLIVSRPVEPLGKDIGYLPGTMEEKMLPWLKPIQDNLQFLLGGDKSALGIFVDKGKIEIEALTYIRGRSISSAFVIIDESQNLTAHEIKTIITRVGEDTKIVLTGDIEQIDNVYINETTNGLSHAVEKFKEFPIAGHVTFKKGERSEVATLAAKVL